MQKALRALFVAVSRRALSAHVGIAFKAWKKKINTWFETLVETIKFVLLGLFSVNAYRVIYS